MISHYRFVLVSRCGQQTAVLFHSDDVPANLDSKVFMIYLLRMQKRPLFSETEEDISDPQNDPIVQKLFEDAIEVLRLAGAYEKDTGKVSALRLFSFTTPKIKILILHTNYHRVFLILVVRICRCIKTIIIIIIVSGVI